VFKILSPLLNRDKPLPEKIFFVATSIYALYVLGVIISYGAFVYLIVPLLWIIMAFCALTNKYKAHKRLLAFGVLLYILTDDSLKIPELIYFDLIITFIILYLVFHLAKGRSINAKSNKLIFVKRCPNCSARLSVLNHFLFSIGNISSCHNCHFFLFDKLAPKEKGRVYVLYLTLSVLAFSVLVDNPEPISLSTFIAFTLFVLFLFSVFLLISQSKLKISAEKVLEAVKSQKNKNLVKKDVSETVSKIFNSGDDFEKTWRKMIKTLKLMGIKPDVSDFKNGIINIQFIAFSNDSIHIEVSKDNPSSVTLSCSSKLNIPAYNIRKKFMVDTILETFLEKIKPRNFRLELLLYDSLIIYPMILIGALYFLIDALKLDSLYPMHTPLDTTLFYTLSIMVFGISYYLFYKYLDKLLAFSRLSKLYFSPMKKFNWNRAVHALIFACTISFSIYSILAATNTYFAQGEEFVIQTKLGGYIKYKPDHGKEIICNPVVFKNDLILKDHFCNSKYFRINSDDVVFLKVKKGIFSQLFITDVTLRKYQNIDELLSTIKLEDLKKTDFKYLKVDNLFAEKFVDWKSRCDKNEGLFCRLISYSAQLVSKDKYNTSFVEQMLEKGCHLNDKISCFILHNRILSSFKYSSVDISKLANDCNKLSDPESCQITAYLESQKENHNPEIVKKYLKIACDKGLKNPCQELSFLEI